MIDCGNAPEIVSYRNLIPNEFMYYLYLPISMKNSWEIELPKRLMYISPLIENVIDDCEWLSRYIYVTAKSMFVEHGCPGNRPGWHIDGFQSGGDLNYIWYDANPTEFAVQNFHNIPNDDAESMIEIAKQVNPDSIVQYPTKTLLRLDETVVHRVSPNVKSCFRTFIKITVSDHRFTGEGNSKNYLIDYDWPIKHRSIHTRNLDHG